MFVLWGLAAATVFAYFRISAVTAALDAVAAWQRESVWVAAFLNRVFFLGVVPGIFLVTVRALRPRRLWSVIVLQSLWCGMWGVITDGWYHVQALAFGDGRDVATLLLKTLSDQFLFAALLNAPANAFFFFWLSQDMSLAKCRERRLRNLVREIVMPNLVTNWCVAFPVVFLLYALPLPLQVQVSGLTSSFWIVVCLQIGARSARGVRDG